MVKKVDMGSALKGSIQNMPSGRNFLISILGVRNYGDNVRSEWIRASTLSPATRSPELGTCDPMSVPRTGCRSCNCVQYVPFKYSQFIANTLRCRVCGCLNMDHSAVEVKAILNAREQKFCEHRGRESVTPLPPESLEWDFRECALWFETEGVVHPRNLRGVGQAPVDTSRSPPGGVEGAGGKKGRVSVVTPTMDSRHDFHERLWHCFQAQTWPDKELVIVETYTEASSAFFEKKALADNRITYVRFRVEPGKDWSIGLKRNIGAHLATGEFIASFDDDDLYAPLYLKSMVSRLGDQQAITLSSWFVYNQGSQTWGFCDPIAWGLAKGLDESNREVREKVYGYGFSYLYRRRAALDIPYEDVNLGEDYQFISSMLIRRGERSVALFHDSFRICLHIQHGGNTSNSILLRDVDKSEAQDLDVMELGLVFKTGTAQTGLVPAVAPPSQRRRSILVNFENRKHVVDCAVNATVDDILELLQLRSIMAEPDAKLLVYRVPPGMEDEEDRVEAAIDVEGLSFLADIPGAQDHIKKLLDQAHRPMKGQDRIGLRIRELWVHPSEAGTQATEEEQQDDIKFETVNVTCRKETVKSFFAGRSSFQVRVPQGAKVIDFKSILNGHLLKQYFPPEAQVMEEHPEKGLVVLKDTDTLPANVLLTKFQARRGYYAIFSRWENEQAQRMVIEHCQKPETQRQLQEINRSAAGDSFKLNILTSDLLRNDVYPAIARRMGIPDDDNPLHTVMHAMQDLDKHPEAAKLWFQAECLLGIKERAANAYWVMMRHKPKNPPPIPDWLQVIATNEAGQGACTPWC
eukprot:TRINITY_DN104952_c0_g1_i1.p1 TRINITY_DN104952_c0_g1~~TRINITY_DN104952_c0_g1_i1.p1  ORF type:complete len:895 (-),score=128.23 TRINITY_DN104952_c0_g1_i1:37-2451(-)